MKQFSFCVDETHSLSECLKDFRRACPDEYSSILALVFTSHQKSSTIWEILDQIRKFIPGVEIAGATSDGEIADGQFHSHTTVLSFLVFEKTKVKILAYDYQKIPLDDISTLLLGECRAKADLTAIGLLGTHPGGSPRPLLGRLSQLPPQVQLFGCGAARCNRASHSYVFAQDTLLHNGLAAIFFRNPNLKVGTFSQLGWRPIGHPMKITEIFSNNVITKLNGTAAVSAYSHYLGIPGNDAFSQNVVSFPLLMKKNDHWIACPPQSCTRDGALVFSSDFQTGDEVWLSYGDINEIQRLTQGMRKALQSFSPEAVLTFSSASRKKLLQNNIQVELASLPQELSTAGAYTYGEILRRENEIELLHSSMLAVGFRESAPRPFASPDPEEIDPEVPLSTAERLAIFIKVLIDETAESPK